MLLSDTVLIVEDDLDIADLIRVNLLELGVGIEHQDNGDKALHLTFASAKLCR